VKPSRVVAIVIGSLIVLPGLGMLVGGAALGAAYAFGRDDDGYFGVTLDPLDSPTPAITAEDIDLNADTGGPRWVLDALDVDLRLRVTSTSGGDVFVGIGPARDVDAYLAGVAHDEVADFDGGEATYRHRPGGSDVAPPTDQSFWTASASGPGTQQLVWSARGGRWAVVVMNSDGTPGVAADVDVGVRSGVIAPLAAVLVGVGALLTAVGVVLIVVGATGGREAAPEPGAAGEEPGVAMPAPPSPVTLTARLDPDLSRWQWLVKWFLAIPHVVVLLFLWVAFVVLTVVAWFAILFTGTYPRGIFDFNVGVLRWTWRVHYYAAGGGLGTDRYPPFSLDEHPDYPATLRISPPAQLSRGLVLVKSWLLAIPHYLVLAVLGGGAIGWRSGRWIDVSPAGGGLIGLLVVIAAVILLFTRRYPVPLFDLIVGLNRWVVRVVAYAALMTDRYPPFRLDQGGSEPDDVPVDS
jgi:Domain of unknown function (DUF4389)